FFLPCWGWPATSGTFNSLRNAKTVSVDRRLLCMASACSTSHSRENIMRLLGSVLAVLALVAAGGAVGWYVWFRKEPLHQLPPPPDWTAEMQTISDANNQFAFDLYAKMREQPGNLFFSPYSAHTALSMTATGAKGNTREQMVKVLHLADDDAKMLAAG